MSTDIRRPIEKVGSDVIKASEIVSHSAEKATHDIKKGFEKLGKSVSDTAAMQSVDLLTDDEIEELRGLIESEDIKSFTETRLSNEVTKGMYLQLSDLGFLHCFHVHSGDVILAGIDPKAHWAVARHDKLKEEAVAQADELQRQRRNDKILTGVWVVAGWIVGVASVFLIDWIRTIT